MVETGGEITKRNIETVVEMERSVRQHGKAGDRIADRFVSVLGSWTFIVLQSVLLMIWVILNLIAWKYRWDPYPFILLNLMLSFQAAYATPIIMMSQNLQAKIDARRNNLDLQINLLAEQESTEALRLLRKLCEHAGIDAGDMAHALEGATRPEDLVAEIDQMREAGQRPRFY